MAKPSMKPSRKGAPPSVETPSPVVGNNTSKPEAGSTVPMNLRVPAATHLEVKIFAAENNMKMVEVMLEAWEMYKKAKGKG